MHSMSLRLSLLIPVALFNLGLHYLALSSSSVSFTATAFRVHATTKPSNTPTKLLATSRPTTTTTTMTSWTSWMSSWWATPQQTLDDSNDENRQRYSNDRKKTKKVTFVRHGCTYMNEYLARGGFGSHDFTDIFTTPEQQQKYHDTPLSPFGLKQARILGSYSIPPTFTKNCDLVVVSPLTRALQTFDLGIKPHLPISESSNAIAVPIMALPYAAERLYLISDVGRPIREVQKDFPYVDFQSSFEDTDNTNEEIWWYQPSDLASYDEWRPTGQQQKYACPAEPYDVFNVRMSRLYYWLQNRPEMNIIVVCHHGVIDWMLDMSFANCQYKQLPFASIQPRTLIRMDQMEPVETTARL